MSEERLARTREHLAPNLAATTQDVKLLVRARFQGGPLPEDSLLARGWRAVHVLPHLFALVDASLVDQRGIVSPIWRHFGDGRCGC